MPIRITSKTEGFRRCGVAHHTEPVEHPAGRFSAAEIKTLKAEPMLTVEEIEVSAAEAAAIKAANEMTVPQLKEKLDALKIDNPTNAKKADLVALYVAAADYSEV